MIRTLLVLIGVVHCICSDIVTVDQLPSSYNLTVSFFPEGNIDNENTTTCPSTEPVTFSTGSLPIERRSVCFNLPDLFASNNTLNSSGIYNYIGRDGYSIPTNVSYTLTNAQAWDPTANYSRIRYTQTNGSEDQRGELAAGMFQTYPGLGCVEEGIPGLDVNETLNPWIRWSCQSSPGGDCHTVPYRIKSFLWLSSANRAGDEECVDAGVYGNAGSRMVVRNGWPIWVAMVGLLALM
ncbi:uncharacterized protein RCC_08190 [Ramularia collo-cygni]|uniref:Secreted protein n=1 Tax=Ramularia collo-cygni TaxID=112498 RepID=A0A2D3UZH0_9PEZI|nr:uncharacterized protein RCC_08190 [Ramularia collo-cygni]CZT22321.1 uncharacterized protein RCC_08190 [Ramularia collo-cygni]